MWHTRSLNKVHIRNIQTINWNIGMVILAFFVNLPLCHGRPVIDSRLPAYHQVAGVNGRLTVQGSVLIANLFAAWTRDFRRFYPDVVISINAQGASAVPPVLLNRASDFGLMSRNMTRGELMAFETKYGYSPTRIPVAIDAIIIYINQNNPIQQLSIPQIDAIFSTTRRCGYPENIQQWGQLGLTGTWEKTGINAVGRNSASGTYDFFKEVALCNGDLKSTIEQFAGGDDVVQSISYSIGGIGYTGVDSDAYGLKALAIEDGKVQIAPSKTNIQNGSYPLSRIFYLYINKPPNHPYTLLQKELIKLILSKTGQQDVADMGYYPLSIDVVEKELAKIK
jgi:phosphate transport system substrate-binding protein